MSTDDNKALAAEFFARFNADDIDGALATMSDDAIWWIAGKPGAAPVSGTFNKEKIRRLLHGMREGLSQGLQLTVKGITAEGDRVAIEAESLGMLKNGRTYNQEYHFLMVMRGGRISAIREYLDTQHVHAVWFQP